VFMTYAIAIGIVGGLLLGGRIDRLGEVHFHWAWLALAGLLAQVALFSAPVADAVGDAGAPIYVLSTLAVFLVVLRNRSIPGLPIVALGAASNLLAIVANGGWMPAAPGALESIGQHIGPGYSNSRELAAPLLGPLTDVFAMPSWLPFANVFSVGDLLIGAGVAVTIAIAMRSRNPAPDVLGAE
jgi:Family of unknown function (DUF5317)